MYLIINHSSMQPIYEQIVEQIKEKIINGEFSKEMMLPSVRTMAKDLKISALTVKKAYDALTEEGFVVTVHGKGSFVACANQNMLLEEKKKDVCLIAMLDTLEYLKKGGRISSTAAFAGGLLNIKPVVNIENGEIHILGKARGSKQGNNLLIQEIRKAGGIDFTMPILLGYTGLTDVLLKKYIEDSSALWENGTDTLNYTTVGSVVGTHTGPGVIAAAFFRK